MAGVLLVALLYALGRYTPLYALAFSYVPGISLFRRPIDGAFVLVAALALLAGQLLADYVREGVPRVARWRLVAVAAGALGVDRLGRSVLAASRTAAGLSLWEVAQGRAAGAAGDRRAGPRAHAAGADGRGGVRGDRRRPASSSGGTPPRRLNAEAPGYYSVLQSPAGADAQALAILERELETRHQQASGRASRSSGVSGSWQNLAMVRGLEATNGYNPLRIGSYDRLVSPGETTHIVDQRLFPASFDGYDCALARELGLEYVVLGRPIEEVPHLAPPAGRRRAAGGPEGLDLPAAATPSRG